MARSAHRCRASARCPTVAPASAGSPPSPCTPRPLRPARHRRRRRHERLHRRGRPAPGRGRRRGRDLHPGHLRRAAAGGRDGARACRSGTSSPARSRAWPRRTCRRSCAPSPTACCAPRRPARPGYYDLIHSHYWLSGQVGWLAKERWGVPLVHTAHTLAKVKNALLADGDRPEPQARVIGEEQVVAEADRLVANTPTEARELIDLYGADPSRVAVVEPGRRPGPVPAGRAGREAAARLRRPAPARAARRRAHRGLRRADPAAQGPRRAAAGGRRAAGPDPALADRLTVVIVGGPSGIGLDRPTALIELAASLGRHRRGAVPAAAGRRRPGRPVPGRRPGRGAQSHNESFGLVALEAQACGTPVVAAAVGGLVTAVRDGVSRRPGRRPRPGRLGRACSARLLAEPGRPGGAGRGRGRARAQLLLGPHGGRPARGLP